jgi:hypothetical protein
MSDVKSCNADWGTKDHTLTMLRSVMLNAEIGDVSFTPGSQYALRTALRILSRVKPKNWKRVNLEGWTRK